MPLTIQTSPFHVQSAADFPPSKKSKPVKRSQDLYGLSSGAVRMSTTYGASEDAGGAGFLSLPVSAEPLVLRTPWVVTVSAERAGPPLVRAGRSAAGGTALSASLKAASAVPWRVMAIVK